MKYITSNCYTCNFFSFCRFLNNPSKDVDLRKWAVEGLAYLTLDADIKEELCKDQAALKSMFDLAKVRKICDCEIQIFT